MSPYATVTLELSKMCPADPGGCTPCAVHLAQALVTCKDLDAGNIGPPIYNEGKELNLLAWIDRPGSLELDGDHDRVECNIGRSPCYEPVATGRELGHEPHELGGVVEPAELNITRHKAHEVPAECQWGRRVDTPSQQLEHRPPHGNGVLDR